MSSSEQTTSETTMHDATGERWAMGHLPSHVRLWLFAAAGLTLDLWSKDWAFRTLQPGESREILHNLCSLQISLNPGALFGFGAGLAPIFVGASVLALLFVLYLFANSAASRWWAHIALGLVLAGALGNLYDRTFQEAYVINFPDGRRDIGKLVQQNQSAVTIGDFPGGANPRTWPRPSDGGSGEQPVVRDFLRIETKVGGLSLWPWIFNVADALLVVGVGILLVNFWFERKREEPEQAVGEDAA
jgi:lipoprotein signal peptidase